MLQLGSSLEGKMVVIQDIVEQESIESPADSKASDLFSIAVSLAPTDAPPLAVERAGEPQWRQAVARSVQDRCDVSEFDKPEAGRDAFPPYNHRGTVVVASAWLAFYVIAAIHPFIASGN
jgi:hypothetical protein